jgi:hypothetical protein
MRQLLALALILLSLAACVRAGATMIDGNTAIISGKGNAFADRAQVLQAVLLRAAEETQARGFTHFVILGAQDATRTGVIALPGQSHTTSTMTGFGTTTGNTLLLNGTMTSNTVSTPGTVIPLVKPGADIIVKMYRADQIDVASSGVWDAGAILEQRRQSL